MERWRPAVARRLWVEADDGSEALHHGTVRQGENEKARESSMREKMNVFFFNYKKKRSQNDVILAHLMAVGN